MATETKTHKQVKHTSKPKQKFYDSCNSPNGCKSPGKPKPGQTIVHEDGTPNTVADKQGNDPGAIGDGDAEGSI